MNKRNNAYRDKKFSISTNKPSLIVSKWFEFTSLSSDSRVLDLWCGNGRNSLYSASLGGIVDAVDFEQINFIENIDKQIQDKISFHHMSVMDFNINVWTYKAIITARLIQYLSPSEVSMLFNSIGKWLTDDGVLMLSYTSSGWILNNLDIDVFKYTHPIDRVKNKLLEAWLEIISLSTWEKKTKHVPYEAENETYDILAKKLLS